ncbi:MAG: ATP-binding protein [Thermoplasmata archaeon]|nr:ATP-binding protein [Thermoplasmata archaeon]
MPQPPAFLRAYAGLEVHSGRTIALAGPPTSGKSARIAELRVELEKRNVIVLTTEGSYRDREVDYGALAPLWPQFSEKLGQSPGLAPLQIPLGIADVFGADGLPSMGGRRRTRVGGRSPFAPGPRTGSGGFESLTAVWTGLSERFRAGSAIDLALLIEDATLLDPASRTLLLELSRLARRRPFLLVLELDSSLPSFSQWEEELLGRPDVDWIRLRHPHADVRETDRLQEILASLPDPTRRLVGFVALLDGSTSEVVLARIARRRTSELSELLGPALAANLLKVGEGRISVAHESWVDHLIESLPEETRREMHRIVAEGLEALSPEPDLQRRFQIADHYFQAEPGPTALRHLVDAAHLAERVLAFDLAEAAVEKAIACIPPAPNPGQAELAVELRILRAKLLSFGGRPSEAESMIREAIEESLLHRPTESRMEELLFPLAQVVYTLGPRPTLREVLTEASDRLQRAKWSGPEAVARTHLAYLEMIGARVAEAEREVSKAHPLSGRPGEALAQIVVLLFDAMLQLWNAGQATPAVPRTLEAARHLLRGAHLSELDLLAEAVEARATELQDGLEAGLRVIDRGLVVAERTGTLWLELYLRNQRVHALLAGTDPEAVRLALRRSQYLVETLHLVPPSSPLFRVWGFEARLALMQGRIEEAREGWLDVLAHSMYSHLPRTRAQALFRLASLDVELEANDRAKLRLDELRQEGLEAFLPARLASALPALAEQVERAAKAERSD